jgi:hypothetical protein
LRATPAENGGPGGRGRAAQGKAEALLLLLAARLLRAPKRAVKRIRACSTAGSTSCLNAIASTTDSARDGRPFDDGGSAAPPS